MSSPRSGPSLRVRRARPEDLDALVALNRALQIDQGDPTAHFGLKTARRDLFGRRPAVLALVATIGDQIAGYALSHGAYDSAHAARGLYLADLYVRPELRRRGIARALIAAVSRQGRRRGATYLWWASKPRNRGAHAFYRALGARHEAVHAHLLAEEAFDALAGPSVKRTPSAGRV